MMVDCCEITQIYIAGTFTQRYLQTDVVILNSYIKKDQRFFL